MGPENTDIAAGGVILGGGSGPLTQTYGYCVDNVLAITMVDSEGNILEITENSKQLHTCRDKIMIDTSMKIALVNIKISSCLLNLVILP